MIDMEVPHLRPYSQPNQEGIFSGFYRQYEDSRVTCRMRRAPSGPTGRRAWFPGLPLSSLEACARRSLPRETFAYAAVEESGRPRAIAKVGRPAVPQRAGTHRLPQRRRTWLWR